MKILTRLPALALTYLAIPFFASAQIAPSGIFREQPTPTPTPQPSPQPTPAAATTSSTETPPPARPEKQPAKTKTKPAANTPRTPPATRDNDRSSGTAAGTVVKLQQMEREWKASSHDSAIIQRMVSDDFIGVTSEGKTVTKKAMLEGSNEETADSSSSVGHMDVRLHGDQMAIVVGIAKQRTKDQAGKRSTTSYRFTDTWVERGGNWQCIDSDATALPRNGDREAPLSQHFQTGSNLPRRH